MHKNRTLRELEQSFSPRATALSLLCLFPAASSRIDVRHKFVIKSESITLIRASSIGEIPPTSE